MITMKMWQKKNKELTAYNLILTKQLDDVVIKEKNLQLALNTSNEANEVLQLNIKDKEATIDKIANATVRLKSRLGKFEREICKFIVEKVGEDNILSAAQIVLVDDLRQKYKHFDVISNGKRIECPVSNIYSITRSSTIADEFYIIKKDRTKDVYRSKVRDEVTTTLKENM